MKASIVILAAAGVTAPAMAQVAAPATTAPTATPARADGIPDIVVTARRRAEALQRVPITISAVSGQDLARKSIQSVEDLRRIAPGVNTSGLERDQASFYIRGQGPGPSQVGTRSSPGVATYFAEIPVDVGGPGLFYDLANVQILKGPQGTLFGRNTTGGAVLIEPTRPRNDNGGYAQVTAGNFDLKQFDAAVNVAPVPDVVAFRLATQISRRRGFTKSIYTNQWLDGRNYESVRATLLLTPAPGFESETIADYYYGHNSGSSEIIRTISPTTNLGGTVGSNPQLAALAGLGAFAGLTPQQVLSIPLSVGGGASIGCLSAALPGCPTPLPLPGPYAPYGGVAATLAAAYAGGGLALIAPTSQLNQVLATQAAIGPRRSQVSSLLYHKSLNWGVVNRTHYDVSDTLTVKNIVAFRQSRSNESLDFDGTPLPLLNTVYTNSAQWASGLNQFSEELQLQGKLPSANLQYIIGGYHERTWPGFQGTVAGLTLGQYTARLPNGHDGSDALFGHIDWNPISWLGFSGGVRQTWDKRSSSLSVIDSNGNCAQQDPTSGNIVCPLAYNKNSHALTYDATVTLRPAQNLFLYGAYRRGYKAGGINLPAPPGNASFNPETVDSFEIGAKGDFDIGFPLRVDGAVFYDKYHDRQEGESTTINPTNGGPPISTFIVANLPRAINKGVELTGTVRPVKALSLTGFVSYLRTYSTSSIPGIVVEGRQLTKQPRWKYGFSGTLDIPVPANLGSLGLSADWSWQSSQSTADYPTLIPTYPSYGVLNARIEWDNVMKKGVDLSVFATNLTDKTYITGGYPIDSLGFDAVLYGEPRMFGASVKVHFGSDR